MTPEERRKVQRTVVGQSMSRYQDSDSHHPYDELLAHFESTGQQAVADAIRFGLTENTYRNGPPLRVDYPEGHPKR